MWPPDLTAGSSADMDITMETHVEPVHNARDRSGTGDGYSDRSTKILGGNNRLAHFS